MASVFGSASPQVLIQQDPAIRRRLDLAQNLRQQGSSTAPVQHFTQALARALQGYMGGRAQFQAEQELKKRQTGATQGLSSALQAATTRPQLPGPNVEDPAALSEDFSTPQFNPGTGQMVTPPPGGTAFNAEPSLGQAPGMQGMISSLLQGGNPDLQGLATQLQVGQLGNEQAFQQQMRLAREKAALTPAKVSEFTQSLIAAGIDPKSPEGVALLRQKISKPMIDQSVKAGAGALGKGAVDILNQHYQEANGALEMKNTVNEVRNAFKGARLGPGASLLTVMDRLAVNLGVAGKDTEERVTKTRETIKGLAELTLAARGSLKGQGQVSNFEQQTLEKARSGNIDDFTEAEMNAFLNVTDRLADRQFGRYERTYKAFGRSAAKNPDMQSYLEIYKVDKPAKNAERKPGETPGEYLKRTGR